MNTTLRKFSKNAKALSPVVASIILIAVTVAVSVVVAAWMGGMSIGLMGNAEQATITNIGLTSGSTAATVTIQNTGNAAVNITAAYINGLTVVTTQPLPVKLLPGQSYILGVTLAANAVAGTQYEAKVTTAKGNNLVLSAFCP